MKPKKNTLWRLWCYSIGEKQGKNNTEADTIAFIRTVIVLQAVICNIFIIFGVVRTHLIPKETQPIFVNCTALETVHKPTTSPNQN